MNEKIENILKNCRNTLKAGYDLSNKGNRLPWLDVSTITLPAFSLTKMI